MNKLVFINETQSNEEIYIMEITFNKYGDMYPYLFCHRPGDWIEFC